MGVSKDLMPILKAQIHQESKWDPNAKSPAGAQGITQFMPKTAPDFSVRFGNSQAAVESQIRGQVKYMNYLIKRYDGNVKHALMAYNMGQGNMDSYLKTGRLKNGGRLPAETRDYPNKIQQWMGYY
ncbi:lytic transglycosylase domain-containing protein [Moraxella bovoculi]|uniref:lytic transglycosylase domain-containing protein n=1 Tax=Moraxella bovoculi TaxID=386891 RepID=UPI0009BA8BE9|nr:lytic transglycosylase domain-containing protein [Moraxella bovoculi]